MSTPSPSVVVRLLTGGRTRGTTPLAFSSDSTRLAAWTLTPNETTLWRIADGAVVMRFPNERPEEGMVALRFSAGAAPGDDRLSPLRRRRWPVAAEGRHPFLARHGALRHAFDARTGLGATSRTAPYKERRRWR